MGAWDCQGAECALCYVSLCMWKKECEDLGFYVPECTIQHFCTVNLNLLLFDIREWYLLGGSLISTVVTYFISSIKLWYFYQHFAGTLLT